MKIERLKPNPSFYRQCRYDLKTLLRQPTDKQARPCADCTLPCACSGSPECTCACSFDCAQAPQQMSSDPESHPVEPGIVPLVYALSSLRLCTPCWSCEGHRDDSGALHKPPRVWFYARSLSIPDLIAATLAKLSADRKLSQPWRICVIDWGNVTDTTFSIEPKLGPGDHPDLERLHEDIRTIAGRLREEIDPIARRRIDELETIEHTLG